MAKQQSAIDQMVDVTVEEAVSTIKILDQRTPAMMHGEPGCGKTRTILDKFESEDYIVIPVLAGQSEPTDIQGIPFNFKDQFAKYLMPWWGWAASDHPAVEKAFYTKKYVDKEGVEQEKKIPMNGKMVLFFDDLPTAHEQTQAAFFKVVDEKHLGEHSIRDNVRIIAAGNRIDDMSATTDMPYALRNRFLHLYVRPDVETWISWAVSHGIHPHVVYFVRRQEKYLTTFEDAKESAAHAWATPRTWEMLSRALYSLEEAGLREYQIKANKKFKERNIAHDHEFIITQGCIGALAIPFLVAIKSEYSAVSPEEIIKDPEGAPVPDLSEIDRLYATVTNLEAWFMTPKNHKHFQPYLKYALRLPAEFGLLLARQFINVMTDHMKNDVRAQCIGTPEFDKMMDQWQPKLNINFEN